jgi:predicted CXXCH cytochrome family protein
MSRTQLIILPMKSILAGAVGVLCGLTAICASATIVGSRHDLRSYLGITDPNAEICVVCHTPHDSNGNSSNGFNSGTPVANAPLWNHSMSPESTVYTMYSSANTGTLDGIEDTTPTGASRLCLSCHDGTVGVDQYEGGANTGIGTALTAANPYYVGTDLTGQHPISITYDSTADPGLHPATNSVVIGGFDNGDAAMPTRSGTIDSLMLQNGKVQCSSCHEVHNTFVATEAAMLRVGMAGSQLCLTCHNK